MSPEVTKTEEEWQKELTPARYQVPAPVQVPGPVPLAESRGAPSPDRRSPLVHSL